MHHIIYKTNLVVITMIKTICSHTIRQKSPNVFGKGPETTQNSTNTYHAFLLFYTQFLK